MNEWKGSDNGYGLLNDYDICVLEATILAAAQRFKRVMLLEVGIASGYTARGIANHCRKLGVALEYHGIDGESGKPHPGCLPEGGTFHQGDSTEIFESIPFGFNVLFIDACHCSNHVILDFSNYSPKVVMGGFVLFHDTNPKWQGQEWMGHGPHTPAFGIGVQAALQKLGLSNGMRMDWRLFSEHSKGDKLGVTVYERIK